MSDIENLNELRLIKREKLEKFVKEGKAPFEIEKYDVTHNSKFIKNNYEDMEGKAVSCAGRIMS